VDKMEANIDVLGPCVCCLSLTRYHGLVVTIDGGGGGLWASLALS